ncbi:MAG: DoxX family protein [Bdellovibrionota bacterium]
MVVDIGLLFVRIVGGFFMLYLHGWPKLQGYAQMAPNFANPIGIGSQASFWLAVFAEVLCALFVFLGIATRWAALPLFVTMAVAAFVVNAANPLMSKELAYIYLCIYAALFCLGGGRFGLDNFVKRARN